MVFKQILSFLSLFPSSIPIHIYSVHTISFVDLLKLIYRTLSFLYNSPSL